MSEPRGARFRRFLQKKRWAAKKQKKKNSFCVLPSFVWCYWVVSADRFRVECDGKKLRPKRKTKQKPNGTETQMKRKSQKRWKKPIEAWPKFWVARLRAHKTLERRSTVYHVGASWSGVDLLFFVLPKQNGNGNDRHGPVKAPNPKRVEVKKKKETSIYQKKNKKASQRKIEEDISGKCGRRSKKKTKKNPKNCPPPKKKAAAVE